MEDVADRDDGAAGGGVNIDRPGEIRAADVEVGLGRGCSGSCEIAWREIGGGTGGAMGDENVCVRSYSMEARAERGSHARTGSREATAGADAAWEYTTRDDEASLA